jgi:DNA mismatch endonuclease (patch repair protein)
VRRQRLIQEMVRSTHHLRGRLLVALVEETGGVGTTSASELLAALVCEQPIDATVLGDCVLRYRRTSVTDVSAVTRSHRAWTAAPRRGRPPRLIRCDTALRRSDRRGTTSGSPSECGLPPSSWASSAATRTTMRANKSRDTKPELSVRRAVHALGLRYRVHIRPLPDLRCHGDLVFARSRVVVFVDGCYWHGCPQHHRAPRANSAYWTAKVTRNIQRDADNDRLLTEFGWLPLRVWEHEDPQLAAQSILEAVRGRRSAGRHTRRTSIPSIRRP